MKDSQWSDCLESNTARQGKPDIQRAQALAETAKERIALITEINEKNCNFVFEDYYSTVLENLQALGFKEGYNILNHICTGYYLRDKKKRIDLYKLFDDIRYKRNALSYYGNRMDYETAKEAIAACKKLLEELQKL